MATDIQTENEELDDRIIEEAINRGELEVIDELVASNYVMHDPGLPEEARGPEGLKQQLRMERGAFPDLTLRVDQRVVEGDTVANRFTIRGTHKGEFMGIPSTGNEIEVGGSIIDRFENGELVESHHILDSLGMMQQLGVVEPPGESPGRSGGTMEQMGAEQRVQDEWDDLAAGFDEFVTPLVFPLAEDALRLVDLQPDMRFLDVAAGSGGLSIPATRLGADVLATDISPALIERLDARARDEELPNLESRVMDGNALELEDDTFDITASSNGVSVFPDIEQGLREMVRVTKPGGRVLIVTFGPPEEMEWLGLFGRAMQAAVPDFAGGDAPSPAFRLADPEKLRQQLRDVGLRDIRVETVTWNFEVQSGTQFWNVMCHGNPKAATMLADLSDEQRAAFEQAVDGILSERSEDGPAVMPGPIHVGIGTK